MTGLTAVASTWNTEPALTSQDVHSATYYLMELEQKYGKEMRKQVQERVAAAPKRELDYGHPVAKTTIKELLHNLYRLV